MIYFISDTHFNHRNILRFDNRPFENIYEHDEKLIEYWNSVVSDKDEVYHLGDVSFGSENYTNEILNRLNGKIYLIRGNHDRVCEKEKNRTRFEWIKDRYELKYHLKTNKHQTIILDHFPIREWNKKHWGSYHLYGHSHSKEQRKASELSLEVSANLWNYTPISIIQVLETLNKRKNSPTL